MFMPTTSFMFIPIVLRVLLSHLLVARRQSEKRLTDMRKGETAREGAREPISRQSPACSTLGKGDPEGYPKEIGLAAGGSAEDLRTSFRAIDLDSDGVRIL